MGNSVKARVNKTLQSLFSSVLILFFSHSYDAYAQQSGCGTNPVQDWYFVNPAKRFVKTTGTITRTKLNKPDNSLVGFYNDLDWNIHIIPDNVSLLKNSRNRVNRTGEIELEVQSRGRPEDLRARFREGTRVEVYGEWVEDMGHDPNGGLNTSVSGGKTELHPLYWMRTIDVNPMLVYVAQDDSGRFVDAQNVLWESFSIGNPPQFRKVTPWSAVDSRTQVFQEDATIARGTSKALPYAWGGGYDLWVFLDSWLFYDCDSGPRVICNDSCGHSPLYFGSVFRSTAPLLRETVNYSVSTEVGTGQKIALLKVIAELDSPPQGALAYTMWQYESSAGTVIGTVQEIKNQPPHRLELSMPYAPALGYNQSSWRVSVSGSTRPYGEGLPSTPPLFTQPTSRTLVTEARTYALDPSVISLDQLTKTEGVCGDLVYLTINESKLLPQIALRSVRWTVKGLKNSDGFAVTSPVDTEIAPATPLHGSGFTAETYTAPNQGRLDIRWERLVSGQPNLAQIVATARVVTELGEEAKTYAALSPLCGVATYNRAEVLDYNFRLLAKRGFRGELYKAVGKASGNDKKWLEAFGKFLNNSRLDEREKKLLVEQTRRGSRLPQLPSKKTLNPVAR